MYVAGQWIDPTGYACLFLLFFVYAFGENCGGHITLHPAKMGF
jgi:hypothetical protein